MEVDDVNLNDNAFVTHRYMALEHQSDSSNDSESDNSDDNERSEGDEPSVPKLHHLSSTINELRRDMMTERANDVSSNGPSSSNRRAKLRKHVGPNLTEDRNKQILDMLVQKARPVKHVAKYFHLSERAIRKIKGKYLENGNVTPKRKGRTASCVIDEEGSNFLHQYLNDPNHNTATLQQMVEAYNEKFGIVLASSTLHNHLINSMRITLKRAGKYPERRTNDETKQMRADFVQNRIIDGNVDYQCNCVFIDEASFNASMRRNYAWSEAGKPAHVQVPTLRAPSTTLLAAVSNFGLIEAAIKVCPKNMKRSKGVRKGTTRYNNETSLLCDQDQLITFIPNSTDFLVFVGEVMDRLDEQDRQGWHLIFDNAPIHTPKFIQEEVERRGYHMVLLPRYSPFLNPIEEFFSKVQITSLLSFDLVRLLTYAYR